MSIITKSLTAFIGLSICGLSGYLLYLLFRKEEDDDIIDVYAQASKFKTLEIKVPKDMVRALIGRNGKNIKLVQEQSNTRINFKDRDGAEDKLCIIRGSIEACNVAENLILDFINNQPVLESEDIWVPVACIGKIIGRCGEKISEIRSLSGAKLVVGDDEQTLTTKRVTIKEQAQQSRQRLEATLSKREPRLPPKFPDIPRMVNSPGIERISPVPGQPDAQFEVYVSAMVDPSRFWLQIVGPKATELDCLVEEMTDYYNKQENRKLHILENINEGDLVAAVFQYDNKWYRAEVIRLSEDNSEKRAELYYVDYGDTDILPCKDLYELRTDFLRLHFQAIECFLARIEPIGEAWSEEAVDKFEEWTHVAQWKKLSAKLNGYSVREKTRAKREGSPVPGVDLFEINNEKDVDIAEELVKAGLAIFKKTDIPVNSRTTSISNLSIASSS
ncbi:tudor and KH domain-containing protein homolog isoform X2 [Anoplophora glabripennis]|uniref:tudor and KH domain-containing protein homolog isoform X2 n=1 Tax=Anoplophora glabripennis TaxID=217634 RepID=UPI0008741A89|nr:tudor and KH domain-containing protein homolog isoform X2 [Anoplophora glabripennis]